MRSLSRVIKADQCVPASPVFVGRKPTSEDGPPAVPAEHGHPPAEESGRPSPLPEDQAGPALEQASEKARQIIEAAQSYSTRLNQEASEKMAREAASVRKRAYAEGYAEGMERGKGDGLKAGRRSGEEEGYKAAVAENRKNIQELGRMIEAVEKSKTQILENFKDDLQNLAVAIARAVLKRELETDEKTMRSIILSAMDAYRNQTWVRIYVSSETAAVLMKADGNIVKALQDVSENVKVMPTDGMKEGDCVVETPDQVIDVGVDSQLKKIRLSIEEAMRAQAQ